MNSTGFGGTEAAGNCWYGNIVLDTRWGVDIETFCGSLQTPNIASFPAVDLAYSADDTGAAGRAQCAARPKLRDPYFGSMVGTADDGGATLMPGSWCWDGARPPSALATALVILN
jgi:hypothetical protein